MNRRQKRRKALIKKIVLTLAGISGAALVLLLAYIYIPRFIRLTPAHDTSAIVSPNQVTSTALSLQEALSRENIQFDSIEKATESAAVVVHLATGGYVYFDNALNYSSQAKLLSALLSRISIEEKNKKVRYIDMRFEKAIVKFE
ncbi:MAG: hypothetical protein ACM3IJ_05380 [Candidatus Levyibacteriota bacterium]